MSSIHPDIRIQVRFPQDVWRELKRLAGNNERSFNKEVIFALREYISQQRLISKTKEKMQQ
jgi:hypothetical protein